MHGMNVVVAKYHSDNLSQEVKKGQRAKFEAGGFNTRAPVGYLNIPRTRAEKGKVVVDENLAPVVRLAFDRYATGQYSYATLADEVFDLGLRTRTGRPFARRGIQWMLSHPFYKGLTVYHGETRPGAHEALVSEELWDEVQRVMAKRSCDNGEKGRLFFLLRGLLHCRACGRRMTAERHPMGNYYRCPSDARKAKCTERYIPVKQLDADFESMLPGLVLKPGANEQFVKAMREIEGERQKTRDEELGKLQAKTTKLEGKLTKLTEGFSEGTVPKVQYESLRDAWQLEIGGAKARIAFLSEDLAKDILRVEKFLEMAGTFSDFYFLATTPEERKSLLNQVIARIEVADRKILKIEYQSPLDLFLGKKSEHAGSIAPLARSLLDTMAEQRGCAA